MKTTLKYREELKDINQMLEKVKTYIEVEQDDALQESGNAVKTQVEIVVPKSNIEERFINTPPHYQHDHSVAYKHIIDDVYVKVRKSKKTGQHYASIGGGYYTGYKYHWLDDGWTDRSGRWHEGIHFTEKALSNAKSQIDQVIDKLIKGALHD